MELYLKRIRLSNSQPLANNSVFVLGQGHGQPYGSAAQEGKWTNLIAAPASTATVSPTAEKSSVFTSEQWKEYKSQCLIYKHMCIGLPIPHMLIKPIMESLKIHPSNQMTCSKNVDTEPGRCRRTDGKTWRCSREAVEGRKYCELHMYRGKKHSTSTPTAPSSNLTAPVGTQPLALSGSSSSANIFPTNEGSLGTAICKKEFIHNRKHDVPTATAPSSNSTAPAGTQPLAISGSSSSANIFPTNEESSGTSFPKQELRHNKRKHGIPILHNFFDDEPQHVVASSIPVYVPTLDKEMPDLTLKL